MTPNTMNKARAALGVWLAQKRKATGLSQAQVAGLIGQNEAFVTRYEAGGRLGIVEFWNIIEILDADPEEMIGAQGIGRLFAEGDKR